MIDFLFSEEVRRDPFPWYEELRRAAPVVSLDDGRVWLLLSFDAVNAALRDVETFGSAITPPGTRTAQWMIFTDPPRHQQLRALVAKAFTPRAVERAEPRIREIANALLAARRADGEMDLVADFALPLPLMIIAELLGAPADDVPRFRRWADVMLRLSEAIAGTPSPSTVAAFAAAHAEMREYVALLLDARRVRPRDDLLSSLVQAEVDGARLTDDEILGFFQLLLVAGHETTTNLIANAMLCFIDNPAQLAALRASPELLPRAVEEVLRYRSPVQAAFRVTTREAVLGGRSIPAGRLVLPMLGSANHDPTRFANPHRFEIVRDPNPHIAFGHGIHHCIGAPLARLEARIALAALLREWRSVARADAEPWTPRSALHVHGPAALRVRFELARPCG